MVDLILRPQPNPGRPEKPWALQLRYHESYGPAVYRTITHVSYETAREIVQAGAPFWLFGEPKAMVEDIVNVLMKAAAGGGGGGGMKKVSEPKEDR